MKDSLNEFNVITVLDVRINAIIIGKSEYSSLGYAHLKLRM